jgi:nucleoside-diphosphate-sugar epimerase
MNLSQNSIVREDCKKSCIESDVFSLLDNSTIFITGGTGFIGKWIAEMVSFINENNKINIKLYLTGRDIDKFKEDVPHLFEKKFITLIQQDVKYSYNLPSEVNYIIHAAGSPDNREHVSSPLNIIETFYKGTQTILDAATRLNSLKKIIHLSSHKIYGKNLDAKSINENYTGILDQLNISNSYAESKRISETLCAFYKSIHRLPVLVLRPFALIGPYQDLGKPWAINNFIRDALLGGPIRILGNCNTIRSYMYGSDMAYWILKSLIYGKNGETYNLGSDQPISLNDLAIEIKNQIDSNINIDYKFSKEMNGEISKIIPDINKIKKDLRVAEMFDICQAIERIIIWNKLSKF